jgi:hypothetical protein
VVYRWIWSLRVLSFKKEKVMETLLTIVLLLVCVVTLIGVVICVEMCVFSTEKIMSGDAGVEWFVNRCVVYVKKVVVDRVVLLVNNIRVAYKILIVSISSVKRLYIDVDGTMLDGSLDAEFRKRVRTGTRAAVVWYEGQTVSDLSVRVWLMCVLWCAHRCGVTLIVWTNRHAMHKSRTITNMGSWWSMFDGAYFNAGKKGLYQPHDGVIIDNEEKYAVRGGIHIDTYVR